MASSEAVNQLGKGELGVEGGGGGLPECLRSWMQRVKDRQMSKEQWERRLEARHLAANWTPSLGQLSCRTVLLGSRKR